MRFVPSQATRQVTLEHVLQKSLYSRKQKKVV